MACNKDLEMIVQYVGVIVQYTKALADHSDTVNICMCDDIFMLFFFVELLFATRELCQYKKGGPKAAPVPSRPDGFRCVGDVNPRAAAEIAEVVEHNGAQLRTRADILLRQ